MYPSFLRFTSAVRPTSFLLALGLTACVAEQEPAPQGALPDVGLNPDQAAPDGGLLRPDAADAATSATPAADQTSELTTLAEFRGTVDVAAGTMRLEVLRGEAVTDAGLRRAQQGLCTLTIVQDGVPGSGPADSLELVTASTGLDAACDGYLASPLFCGAVTVRSFYASPQTQVFAQILALAPSTGFSVQNGDLVPGASSGLGSWAYGDLGDAAATPANAGVRNWVFARSGGNFTFTGRLVANVSELCDGLDNDCDGATDEGLGCRTQGQDCTATVDCSADLVCTASVCSPAGCPSGEHLESGSCASDTRTCALPNAAVASEQWTGSAYGPCTASACVSGYWLNTGACVLASTLGTACTLNAECASGFCATGPDGTANDRCAPTDMTYIPAGTFTMGSPLGELGQETDETEHSVTLSRSFFVGQTEVTQGQWKALSGGINPSYFQATTGTAQTTSNANDSGPVENLDWYAAVAFANARSAAEGLTSCYTLTGCTDAANGWQDGLHSGCTAATLVGLTCTGYRLPTESEWEYAARGGTTTATYMGDLSGTPAYCDSQANLDGIAWWCVNGGSRSQAVGGKTANSFGLYDMLGNVWEWTGDWYGAYPATVTDPTGPATGDGRVPRGGSYGNNAVNTRAAVRLPFESFNRVSNIGFRLSRTVTRDCTALPLHANAGVEAGNATGWGACEATACSASYHLEGGACLSDTRACSLPNATLATESWTGSAYGTCTASACLPTHHLEGAECLSDTGSCSVLNGTGSRTYNAGAWSVCLPAACDAGFHTTGTACEADIIACVVQTARITEGTQTWFGSAYGSCVATACDSTYHVESGSCLSDTRACTLPNASSATEQWTGTLWGTCTATACDSGFSLLAGACVAVGCGNTVVESGEGCDDGNSSNTDACTNACQLAACGDTYLQGAEGCDDGNTLTEACTYGDFSCTVCSSSCASVSGAATYCGDGQLQATEVCDAGTMNGSGACSIGCACATGYHLESGLCVGDTRACNLPNATVATESWSSGSASYGPCTVTTCASGYWLNAGACALQSILGAPCTLNAECASGFCATGPDGTANDRCAPEAMNYIPAGTFTMGSPASELGRNADETQHSVTISRSFFMGQTELTQGQWKALSGGTNPSFYQSTTGTVQTTSNANDSGPAEQMDWYAAVAFANARSAAEGLTSCYTLTGCTDAAIGWQDGIHSGCTAATFAGLSCTGYRLPTESEWEYAARAGTTTATYGGDLSAISGCATLSGTGGFAAATAFSSLAWFDCNAASRTQATGSKLPNAFGLSDMLGNVWEWTGDWSGTYPGTVTDPTGPTTGTLRVDRGGAWSNAARPARAAFRSGDAPGPGYSNLGFRLVRTAL